MDTLIAHLDEIVFLWIHIAGAVILLGIIFTLLLLATSSFEAVAFGVNQQKLAATVFKAILISSLAILASGLYNYTKNLERPPIFHAILGIKILLALHIFVTSILLGRQLQNKPLMTQKRRLVVLAVSGLLVLFLAVWLNQISLAAR